MKDALTAILAIIGAFVMAYAMTHEGRLPHLFPREGVASHDD